MVVVRANVLPGAFEYVIAGHPAPVFLPLGGPTRLVTGAGFPIGMIDNAVFEEERLTMEPGDRLYCYTDGVIEALNAAEEEYGIDRLMFEIDRSRDLPLRTGLDAIARSVRDWCGGRLRDDVSLLGVERAARPE